MSAEEASKGLSVRFEYVFCNIIGHEERLGADISIPFTDDVTEMAQHIIASHHADPIVKCMDILNDVNEGLKRFVNKHNQTFYNKRDDQLIEDARNGALDTEQLIKAMELRFREEMQECAEYRTNPDDDKFSQRFHHLVHSPLLPEILHQERHFADLIADTKRRMDVELTALATNQQDQMDATVEQLDLTTTTEQINLLLSEQYAQLHQVRDQWESELDAIKGHQKSKYHQWIDGLAGSESSSTIASPVVDQGSMATTSQQSQPSMEESFTIHLGSQLKHMHNIRILAANVIDLCGPLHAANDSLSALNMALGLYSSSLYGIVVLTPVGRVQATDGVDRNANMSTEFHFKQINEQLDVIQKRLNKTQNGQSPDSSSTTYSNSNCRLKSGDFFVTRHSNLSQTHVIFHLITDEAFNRSDEINSRHPVILGLRNILKTACRHDITQLTIPSLLRHEMSEDMTVPWCVRRAELVFKCAKGFMIESASWGGSQLSTLQLLLPHDISEDLFGTLVGMVPHIFRVANPKVL